MARKVFDLPLGILTEMQLSIIAKSIYLREHAQVSCREATWMVLMHEYP